MAKRRRVNKKNVLKLFITLVVIIGIVYLFIKGNFAPDKPTYALENDKTEINKTYNGFIIRKEYVYRSNNNGEVFRSVNDGERVKEDQEVMTIKASEPSEEAVEVAVAENFDKETIDSLEIKIAAYEKEIASLIKSGSYEKVSDLTENLHFVIRQRRMLVHSDDEDTYDEEVIGEELNIGETEKLYIPHAGIISFYTDGLEKELTYSNVMKIKVSDVIASIAEPVLMNHESVKKGDMVAKIIDDDYFYIVMQIEKSEISNFALTKDIEIKVNDTELTGYIDNYILSDNEAAVLIKVESHLEDYHKLRGVEVVIEEAVYEGLTVQKTSLVTIDDQVGVYVETKYNEFEFVPVNILSELDFQVIVKADFFHEVVGEEVVRHSTVKANNKVLLDASLLSGE